MIGEGLDIIEHIDSLSMMGFFEVLRHLPYLNHVMNITTKRIIDTRPDRIILIDYPGFNLRLAKRLAYLGIPITYFILPQVWAWKEKRIRVLKEKIDQPISIFPFELEWFRQRGLTVDYVGHPFIEKRINSRDVSAFYERHNLQVDKPILILLPGSRQQEIERHWPVFMQTIHEIRLSIPDVQTVLGKAPGVQVNPIPEFIHVETEDISSAIHGSTAALASSGTVTLESAVMDTPAVVCYKLSGLSWLLAKALVNVPHASMANLIADDRVVPEFLQNDMVPHDIASALIPLLTKTTERKAMLQGYDKIRRSLGAPGVYDRTADTILNRMNLL